MENKRIKEIPKCCKEAEDKNDKKKGVLMGIVYGLIPHAGCLAFILFSIIGLTAFASVFKPLLSNSYLFYISYFNFFSRYLF